MANDDDNNNDDFDPGEWIEREGEPPPEPNRRALIDIRAELEREGPQDEFAYFNRRESPVTSGSFSFKVHQHVLKEGLSAVGVVVRKRPAYFGFVKCTIFRTRLRLQTFTQASFAEYFIPLVEPSPSIPATRDQDLAVAFIFHHPTLLRLVSNFPDTTLDFTSDSRWPFRPGILRIRPYFGKIDLRANLADRVGMSILGVVTSPVGLPFSDLQP
jgi:hypothetical protein